MAGEIPSLKEMILRKIPVLLWNRPENLDPLMSFRFSSEDDKMKVNEWNELIYQVKKQALTLQLPKLLNKELMLLIKPIASEFIKWRAFHENYFFTFDCCLFVNLLSWTPQGVIDYYKTAKNMVMQRNELTLHERYMLSCLYCLEDNVRVIWERFSDEERSSCVENTSRNPRHKELVAFWTSTLNLDVVPDDCRIKASIYDGTVNRFAFENAANTGNFVATKYFFRKLTQEEIGQCLSKITEEIAYKCSFWMITFPVGYPKESYSDILCYLLALMNEEERMQVFRRNPYKVLRSFLDWPRQNEFLKHFKDAWSFLSASDYQKLLCILIRNLNLSAYNYAHLFEKVFLQNPTLHQEFVLLNQCDQGFFLYHLLDCNDVKNIELVIKNVEPDIKNQLLTTVPGFHTFLQLILEDKLYLLEMFIEECKLSRVVREQIKEDFTEFVSRIQTDEELDFDKFDMFFNMLEGKATPGKKISEE